MKLPAYNPTHEEHVRETELLAQFGEACLVRHLSGRYEVRGGSEADLADARLWCSIFCKSANITWPTQTPCGAAVPAASDGTVPVRRCNSQVPNTEW